jgi:hypothetical protein
VSVEVDSSYRRWSVAQWTDPGAAFAAYAASLDREEIASLSYEQALREGSRLLARDRRRRREAAQRRSKARRPDRTRRRRRTLRTLPRIGGTRGRGPAGRGGRARPRRWSRS